MSQIVIYKGVMVKPVDRSGDKIRIQTTNTADAQKAGIPFKDLENGVAVFEDLVPEDQLVPVNE